MSSQPRFLFFFILHFFLLITCIHCYTIKKPNSQLQYPCLHPRHRSYPFCNTSLSLKTRAQSLISLLTLDEKIQQLSDNVSAIPRLGIPPYEWWSESLHGIATDGPGISFNGTIKSATIFPQVILTTAAFNRSLWAAVASAIAVEAMAMQNVGQAGLTFFAPNINIFRDPRWGRGQETPGEDPMVVSAYAVEYVRAFQWNYDWEAAKKDKYKFGLQRRALGDDNDDGDEDRLMLSACCKHFTAYDLEKWGQFTRYNFNAVVTDQDMEDTYQAPFRSCIQKGKASCLMCSYNSVNGIPACANRDLLQKARSEWNFRGYITSDCDAVATIYENHKYTKTPEDAVAAALKAGTDINCGTYMLRHMKSAIEQGKVLEEEIDRALLYLFSVQFRLGLFDGESSRNQFRQLGPHDVCTSEHRKLALEAARQGIVLLKNEQKVLPLDKHGILSLAVIGPLANSTKLGGDYTGFPCNPRSILEELQEYVNNIYHATGCQDAPCNSSTHFSEALSVAKQAEYVIVVAGLDLSQETEETDRYSLLLPGYQTSLVTSVSLLLPGYQTALVTSVAAVSRRPLILVLIGGGPIDVSFAAGDPHFGSIIWIGYPGETGAKAISEIIFGHYNPGGRLPMTWYPESFTNVPMTDMNMRADPSRNYPGRTYRFYTGDRIYGFGHGLSYTSFIYKLVSAPRKLSLQESIKARRWRNMLYQRGNGFNYVYVDEVPYCSSLRFQVQISVTNNGDMDGSEVVLLFSKASKKFKGSPERQLIGFERVHVLSYETAETSFLVDPCEHLSFADEHGKRILPMGDHILISENIEHIFSIEI
ncbi:Non-reducing end alpha-L-arabinofuranosidase [Handroanthus impetiginosus]|uniref:Non-reducing end alpha-L-arabinofuranosidase n=1 Tax=Handroanthus impetiginosus TaxID=429701 RepID=A0A2G9HVW0_9LAMI|nr:Non-reducing end alpha-L-arabinofuranosidase [Handroanthus impetiginosus]